MIRLTLLLTLASMFLVACEEDLPQQFPPIDNSTYQLIQIDDPLIRNPSDTISDPIPIKYLALGDSYTIGEGVTVEERWPLQLMDTLNGSGYIVDTPRIIAQTGWTTGALQSAIFSSAIQDTFDMVSLMIGVNNQFWGGDLGLFQSQLSSLLEKCISLAGGDTSRVFVLSIPDWGLTPVGMGFGDPTLISATVDNWNNLYRSVVESYGIKYFDITPISRLVEDDLSLVADDNLHPSGEMYRLWVEYIYPDILAILSD